MRTWTQQRMLSFKIVLSAGRDNNLISHLPLTGSILGDIVNKNKQLTGSVTNGIYSAVMHLGGGQGAFDTSLHLWAPSQTLRGPLGPYFFEGPLGPPYFCY